MPSPFTLPKIYPITDRTISTLSHSEQLKGFIDGGAAFVQLREKSSSSIEFFNVAKECLDISRANGIKLIINDRVDIALALGADGVHLGQDDLPPDEARKILGNDTIVGYSTHSLEQAITACRLPVDYIAIGPIFATKTKLDHDEPVGLKGIEIVRRAIGDVPLVAIGGIGIDDIPEVLAAGADSAALISSLIAGPESIANNCRRAVETANRRK